MIAFESQRIIFKNFEEKDWSLVKELDSEPDNTRQIELGYRLRKKFWRKGYATEGSQILVDQGLKDPSIKNIWAHAMLANEPSINIMKKLGLTFHSQEIYEQWPGEDKRCIWYLREKSN